MSWSTTATLPQRQDGPGWATTAAPPTVQTGTGWFTLTEKVAQFSAIGNLSTNIATNYPNRTAPFTGTGTLTATVQPVKTVAAAFTATGSLTGFWLETKAVTANFTATGSLVPAVNDGLSGIITGGTPLTDGLSGIVTGGLYDGLSATVIAVSAGPGAVSAALAGSGTLTATSSQKYSVAAVLAGNGALSATVTAVAAGVSDDFNRANSSTSAGTNWTNRANTVGIASNAAYPTSTGAWCVTSHNTTMGADDMEASITLGTATSGNEYAMVGIGADTTGEMVFADTAVYSGQYEIYSVTDWAFGGLVKQANSASGGWTTGDVLKLKRVGNVYTAYVNGSSVATWTDSGNLVPRDSSHRLVCIGMYDDGSGHRRIDSFAAI